MCNSEKSALTLHVLSQMADEQTLVDITTLQLDILASYKERMVQLLKEIKNPYQFKCGDTVIKIKYNVDGPPLKEVVMRHFIAEKQADDSSDYLKELE